MKILEDMSFDSTLFADRDSGAQFRDIEFHNCYFQGCTLSVTLDPALRSTVENVRLINCSQRGCCVYGAIVRDAVVDRFNTNGQLFQTWGAVFDRVVLRGRIDNVMFSSTVFPGVATPAEQKSFDDANMEYYRGVDWALDISRGEFKDLCIRGLPGHLIRRDPETQILVTREKALEGRWKDLEFQENLFPGSLDSFLQRGHPDLILVAPKRHRKFPRFVEDLQLLRKAGVAEPD
jgi:hypothetical protein